MNWKPVTDSPSIAADLRSRAHQLVWLLAWSLGMLTAAADIIYDDSQHDLGVRFNPGTLEIGDEILVTGTARYLTNFSFEYWGTSTTAGAFAGQVEARVRFYLNDGVLFHGYATPGTVFYDSSWFGIGPTARSALIFSTGNVLPSDGLFIPTADFTWSVQFQGMGMGDDAGVDLYSPVVAGFNYSDYWERDSSGWTLRTNSYPMNFAARMEATSQPQLHILLLSDQAKIYWPPSAVNFVLQASPTIGTAASWNPITNGISTSGSNYIYTFTATGSSRFFRLSHPN
jgi:hypothetical protein